MTRLLSNILNWIILSNIFVAFCVLALTISSEVLLGTSNFKISQFVFFATLFTYNFQRIVKLTQRNVINDWYINNRILAVSLMLISGIICAYNFYYFRTSTQIAIIISAIIAILYPFRLRLIPFAKIFVIALVWTISTMLLLVFENSMIINQNIILHLAGRFLFVFAITIPFDIRDLKFDDSNIKTIPIIFGERKSKWISVLTLIFAQIIIIVQILCFDLHLQEFIAFLILFLLSAFFIINTSEEKSAFYFSRIYMRLYSIP